MKKKSLSKVELVMVSVVYACKQFHHYLLPRLFVFMTSYSFLPQLINGTNLSMVVMKWVIEIREFSFTFLVEESTRATLADLLIYKQSLLLIKETTIAEAKMVESQDLEKSFTLFFDGSYRKSHDASSGGFVLYNPQGQVVTKRGIKIDAHSNNEAKYLTLELGLHWGLDYGVKRLQIKGDALLVFKHALGVCKTKNSNLKNMCFCIKGLLRKLHATRVLQG